jgi:hypothetical protein
MNIKRAILLFLILFSLQPGFGQKFTAENYWKMEHDSLYMILKQRYAAGDTLSSEESGYFSGFKQKLDSYFEQMTDDEKAFYYRNRKNWERFPTLAGEEIDHVFSGDRSTFTKYVVSSSAYGFLYGLAGCYVLGLDGYAVAGVPFITSGASAIVPVATIKDRKVTTNSLLLSLHGKSIGAFQGAMLGQVFTGKNNSEEGSIKLTIGIATASSIALGYTGFYLGANKPWTQGRVSLYSHYGWLMPLEGISIMAAMESENPAFYGSASILFGTAGYLVADRVADKYDFTRGDVVSIQAFTLLNLMLGIGILVDIESNSGAPLIIPGTAALAGTIAGQAWLRDARLTTQQGWNSFLITTGGTAIGFGFSRVISEEFTSLDYILPYITGFISYAITTTRYKDNIESLTYSKNRISPWQFSFMPQSILINKKLSESGKLLHTNGFGMVPLFSASVRF